MPDVSLLVVTIGGVTVVLGEFVFRVAVSTRVQNSDSRDTWTEQLRQKSQVTAATRTPMLLGAFEKRSPKLGYL